MTGGSEACFGEWDAVRPPAADRMEEADSVETVKDVDESDE